VDVSKAFAKVNITHSGLDTHHVALEVQLSLEDSIDHFVILARPCTVELVVGAHERSDTGFHAVSERPEVELVQGPVVDVAAHRLTVSFLFVADEVFCTGLDAGVLHALDGVGHRDSGQVWVGGEALPISASMGDFALY
jgi:hypothetical protein